METVSNSPFGYVSCVRTKAMSHHGLRAVQIEVCREETEELFSRIRNEDDSSLSVHFVMEGGCQVGSWTFQLRTNTYRLVGPLTKAAGKNLIEIEHAFSSAFRIQRARNVSVR